VTVTDERPRNGHAVQHTAPAQPLDGQTARIGPAGPGEELVDELAGHTGASAAAGTSPIESERVTTLRQRLADRETERDLLLQLQQIDSDPVFDDVRSEAEAQQDRKVAEQIRTKARKERKRAGQAQVRRTRRTRRWERWDERATHARDRILDPARAVGSDYRKLVASSAAAFALIAGGVLFMATNVHDGLVGTTGSWTAYLVEPLASVLLVISMIAQFTARARGIRITRGFYLFDGFLATASTLLNVLPSGFRYGWPASDLVAHILVPALVVGAVIAWHLVSSLYGTAIALSKDDPVTRERLLVLRKALAAGALPADNLSATQVIKYLRATLPNGIGHMEGRRLVKQFLGF
jgi:hypothetical protein